MLVWSCSSSKSDSSEKNTPATSPAEDKGDSPKASKATVAAPDAAPKPPPGPAPKSVRLVVHNTGAENKLVTSELDHLGQALSEFAVTSDPATVEESVAAEGFAQQESPTLLESWGAFEHVLIVVVNAKKKKSDQFEGTVIILRPPSSVPLLYYRFDRDTFEEGKIAFNWFSSFMDGEDVTAK